MNILYKKLIELVLWHDYYTGQAEDLTPANFPDTYDIRRDIEIVPTRACEKLLKAYRLVFRHTSTGIVIFASAKKEAADVLTRISMDSDLALTFLIRLKNPAFPNFTNIDLAALSSGILYFNNLQVNSQTIGTETLRFLSNPLNPFNAAGPNYALGSLVTNGGKVYEALQDEVDPAANAPGDIAFWEEYPISQYVSSSNRVDLQSPMLEYRSESDMAGFEIQLEDMYGNVRISDTLPDDIGAVMQFQMDLSALAAGKYSLKVDGNLQRNFCLLHPLKDGTAIGMIELFHLGSANPVPSGISVPSSLDFIDHSGGKSAIAEKTYVLRFKNRLTTWKYLFANAQVVGNYDLDVDDLEPDPQSALIYYSTKPVPLSSEFYNLAEGKENPPPNPSVSMIKPENGKIYSEIYVNV